MQLLALKYEGGEVTNLIGSREGSPWPEGPDVEARKEPVKMPDNIFGGATFMGVVHYVDLYRDGNFTPSIAFVPFPALPLD